MLSFGVLVAVLFGFCWCGAYAHWRTLVNADIFPGIFRSCVMRLRNSVIPVPPAVLSRSYANPEQIREMITSSTLATIVDLPFFPVYDRSCRLLPHRWHGIAPAAALLMILPGVALQKKLAVLANQSRSRSDATHAVLVESVRSPGGY